MLADFEREHPSAGANLRDLIETTPELKSRMLSAIEQDHLKTIRAVDPEARKLDVLAQYQPQDDAMSIAVDVLERAGNDPRTANTLRVVLGHEVEHPIGKDADLADKENTLLEIKRIADGPSPHDYTDAIADYERRQRPREIDAEIAGINTLCAHVRRENPDATPQQFYAKLYAASDFMQKYIEVDLDSNGRKIYVPKRGLTIDPDAGVATTAQNRDAVGTYFYENNGYPQLHANQIFSAIEAAEDMAGNAYPDRPSPEIQVNLRALGLAGMPMPPGFSDVGPAYQPQSRQQASPSSIAGEFPVTAQDVGPHPYQHDRAYFQMLRERLPEHIPDHAVAHAMLEAKRGGLEAERVDPNQIGLSQGKICIGGTTPGFHVSVDPAKAPPMEQVQRELQAMTPQQAQAQAPAAMAEELQPAGSRSR